MPKNDHYVIIGNGPAGNRAADRLRESDKEARVTIISDEAFSFYYRHKLPDFIAGRISEESLKVRPYTIYKEKNIRLRLGQRVERIDPEEKVLYLKHMEKVGYTKLILATGGSPRVPPSLIRFTDYFTFMTNYNDAVSIRPELQKAKDIIVIGGDLISLRFIKMLTGMKKNIFFILSRNCFWPIDLTSKMAGKISTSLEKKKIKTSVDIPIASITRQKNKLLLEAGDGRKIRADMICSFLGLKPNIDFVVGSGIDTEKGVLVNEHLQTNYPDIYACGDCAQIYNPKLKDYWISIGSENAAHQGEAAALSLLGAHQVIKPVSKKRLRVEGVDIGTSWWKQF
jgi:NAD(P)H-nitrite reductase large subunit